MAEANVGNYYACCPPGQSVRWVCFYHATSTSQITADWGMGQQLLSFILPRWADKADLGAGVPWVGPMPPSAGLVFPNFFL